ncbi:MAG: hypothetical protein RBS53_06020 [Bacteroidales bacterium]|jgi:hypothetical protein|nr:hypothetical protein [Bacteroidales bacterium]NLM92078.1 hypothetical protein [Bacteroidales bacterium]
MPKSASRKYNMMVSLRKPGEYQVRLVRKEGGIFRVLLSATSINIPSLDWLISCYEQGRQIQTLT